MNRTYNTECIALPQRRLNDKKKILSPEQVDTREHYTVALAALHGRLNVITWFKMSREEYNAQRWIEFKLGAITRAKRCLWIECNRFMKSETKVSISGANKSLQIFNIFFFIIQCSCFLWFADEEKEENNHELDDLFTLIAFKQFSFFFVSINHLRHFLFCCYLQGRWQQRSSWEHSTGWINALLFKWIFFVISAIRVRWLILEILKKYFFFFINFSFALLKFIIVSLNAPEHKPKKYAYIQTRKKNTELLVIWILSHTPL